MPRSDAWCRRCRPSLPRDTCLRRTPHRPGRCRCQPEAAGARRGGGGRGWARGGGRRARLGSRRLGAGASGAGEMSAAAVDARSEPPPRSPKTMRPTPTRSLDGADIGGSSTLGTPGSDARRSDGAVRHRHSEAAHYGIQVAVSHPTVPGRGRVGSGRGRDRVRARPHRVRAPVDLLQMHEPDERPRLEAPEPGPSASDLRHAHQSDRKVGWSGSDLPQMHEPDVHELPARAEASRSCG